MKILGSLGRCYNMNRITSCGRCVVRDKHTLSVLHPSLFYTLLELLLLLLSRFSRVRLCVTPQTRYDAIVPKESQTWTFPVDSSSSGLAVRVCFSSANSMSRSAQGTLTFGGLTGVVSNNTQMLVDIPLEETSANAPVTNNLVFANTGTVSMMLRPRRDIELLLPGDSFLANLVRSTLQSLAVIAFLAAFGIFLSAALSRPVAVFTALVVLLMALMAPDTLDQFAEGLDIPLGDRIGLALSRGVAFATSAFMAPTPVSDLATGRCIEWTSLARTLLEDVLFWPAVFLSLSALIVRRHPMA